MALEAAGWIAVTHGQCDRQAMLPAVPLSPQARRLRLRPWCAAAGLLTLTLLGVPRPALAQADVAAAAPPAATAESPAGSIAFEADRVEYSDNAETVTASGNVVLRRGDQSMRAETVTWNRDSGQIVAQGSIRMVDEDGNELFTERLELTDEFKAGAMQSMLLALREGGRLAAESGTRDGDGNVVLIKAAYSGCAAEDEDGCPKEPSWRVTASRVVYNATEKKVSFRAARLEIFGISLLPLPGLALATDGRPQSGLLVPDVGYSPSNGIELSQSWYQRFGTNRDLTATAYAFTEAPPMVSGQFRALTDLGAYQITGYATQSRRVPLGGGAADPQRAFRGYLFTNGRFQLDPHWSISASGRVATDRTFLRRYAISRDDRLRSMVDIERIDDDSYLSIAGWITQTMRVGERQGQVPIALPVVDYRRRLADPLLGGKIELQANSLMITRTAGQDTQRAFASARWDLRKLTGMGQEITLTALVRGDVYHSDENALTSTVIYQGEPGWQTRGIATAAIDVKWPFVGKLGDGTQILTPRVQIVASPSIRNLAVPNEDARAIDLEDSNLFALNRFPGYDRIEDGVRFTYGLDWQFERPNWRVKTTIGQSYRLTNEPTLLPDGTGLSSRSSDIVGRTEVRFRDLVKLTHRFRLDKDSLGVRRNEIDATIGSARTYAEVGYLRLNRDIDALEDLQDREELRLAGRVAFAKYWSVFGSGVVNLTNRAEDPSFTLDGFQLLRSRLGVSYQDDCLELGVTWRRDYATTGDARRGNSFQIFFALRNLGVR